MSGGHRSCLRAVVVTAALCLVAAAAVRADQSARPLLIGATIGNATSLRLSHSVLTVGPTDAPGPTVIGSIEFHAAARTRSGGEVILTVEALRSVDELAGGASDAPVVIDFAGSEAGLVSGVLSMFPQVAGRWVGSGVRRGRLVFTVRGPEHVSGGVVPLRFVLSTP